MAKNEVICCICGKPFDDERMMGNNAEPYQIGRCCNKCNKKYVIPSRVFSIQLNGNMIRLFKEKQKEIESGEFELGYNRMYDFGYTLQDRCDPKQFKEWKRKYYVDFCRSDEKIKDLESKLITAAKSKLKDADDVWIEYRADKSNYLVRLLTYSSKHPRK